MSRIMGIIMALMYVAGGALVGRYGHTLLLLTEIEPLSFDSVSAFVISQPLGLVGIVLIVIAGICHRISAVLTRNSYRPEAFANLVKAEQEAATKQFEKVVVKNEKKMVRAIK